MKMLENTRRMAFEALLIIGILFWFVVGTVFDEPPKDGPDARGICRSVFVRNHIENLTPKLRGCRVIEGYLQVALIEKSVKEDYINLSFPELTEITHYLVVYRVNGLVNIGSLFPNLTIIRGRKLLGNAALAISDNPVLEEIGLYSLTHIQGGSIVINKNPKLCFAGSIDWNWFMRPNNTETYYDLVIVDNGKYYECQLLEEEFCKKCPEKRCWTKDRCQILKMDCHPLCAGGCTEPNNPDACITCQGVLHNNRCIESCPPGTYEYEKRLCLTRDECLTRLMYSRRSGWYYHYTFNGTCITECPGHYQLNKNETTCVPCEKGKYRNVCTPVSESDETGAYHVTSIAETNALASCTHIRGSLTLVGLTNKNFSGMMKVLEHNLGWIEEISGQLKIMKTEGLPSLNFFSSLRVIGGELKDKLQNLDSSESDASRHTLVVKRNKDLYSLWDWDRKEGGLKILKGPVLFHENPKLCVSEINKLIEKANVTNVDSTDVSDLTNGREIICYAGLPFNLTVAERTPYNVVLALYKAAMPGRYMIYYRRSLGRVMNTTEIYKSLYKCGAGIYEWQVTDDAELSPTSGTHYFVMEHLQPATEYVYFLRSFNSTQATTHVYNVTTLPAQPSPPLDFHVNYTTDSSAILNWRPPYYSHGKIEYYLIRGYYQTDQLTDLLERDYCKHKLKNEPWTETKVPTTTLASNSTQLLIKNETTVLDSTIHPNSTQTLTVDETMLMNSKRRNRNTTKTDLKSIDRELQVRFSLTTEEEIQWLHLYQMKINDSMKAKEKIVFNTNVPDNPDDCIPCISLIQGLREPRNVTETKNKAKIETKMEMCNKYEQKGHFTLSKIEPELEQCDAYIYNLIETKSQMLTAVRKGLKKKHSPEKSNGAHIAENITGSDGRYERFSFEIDVNNNTTTITNLRHFSQYVVKIAACPDPKTGVPCSRDSIITIRTKPKKGADRLDGKIIIETSDQTAHISWEEPSLVNSFIHSYILSYRSKERENMEFEDICVTAKHFRELNHTYSLQNLPSGQYEVRLRAISLYGEGPYTSSYFTIETSTQQPISSITIIITIGIMIVVVVCFILLYLRYLSSRRILYASVNPKYEPVYFEDHWEVQRDNLVLVKQLGRGIFGSVHEGIVQPDGIRCAVKTTTSTNEEDNMTFLKEATIMKEFSKAYHIVKLIGVVSKGSPAYVIMELMEQGDLKTFLLRSGSQLCDETRTLPDSLVLKMAAQIADGMCFLEAKKFVHRDLAARNCMVAADNTIKIGDFGLARDIYETDYYRKGDKATLPIRWMAPESLRDGVFSCSSDVWSFGVVLWEITTLAQMPYHPRMNEEVIKYIQTGQVLEIPGNTNEVLKPLMRHCWQWHASQRPRFVQVMKILDSYMDSDFRKVSYFHNGEGSNDSSSVIPFNSSATEDCYIYSDENDEINLYLGQSPTVSDASTSSVKYTRFLLSNKESE